MTISKNEKYLGTRFFLTYFREFTLMVAGGLIGAIISSWANGLILAKPALFILSYYGAVFIAVLILLDFIVYMLRGGIDKFKQYYNEARERSKAK